jgi:hypothetical protein
MRGSGAQARAEQDCASNGRLRDPGCDGNDSDEKLVMGELRLRWATTSIIDTQDGLDWQSRDLELVPALLLMVAPLEVPTKAATGSCTAGTVQGTGPAGNALCISGLGRCSSGVLVEAQGGLDEPPVAGWVSGNEGSRRMLVIKTRQPSLDSSRGCVSLGV